MSNKYKQALENKIIELEKEQEYCLSNIDKNKLDSGITGILGLAQISILKEVLDQALQEPEEVQNDCEDIILSENDFNQLVEACQNPQPNEKLKELLNRPLKFKDCTEQKTFTLEDIEEILLCDNAELEEWQKRELLATFERKLKCKYKQ